MQSEYSSIVFCCQFTVVSDSLLYVVIRTNDNIQHVVIVTNDHIYGMLSGNPVILALRMLSQEQLIANCYRNQ